MRKSRFILWLITALVLSISPVYATGASKSLVNADDAINLSIENCGSASFQFTGTFSGTITFEASDIGSTWVAVNAINANTGAIATTTTGTGLFVVPSGGFQQLRARFSTATSGTVVANAQCGNGSQAVSIAGGSLAANQTVDLNKIGGNTVSAGNGASGTGVLRVAQVSDGTGVLAGVTTLTGTTTLTPGTGATNLGKAEDSAHTSADTGVLLLGVRNNTASALAGSDGEYIPITTDTNGAVWASLATKLDSTNDSVTIAAPSASIASGAVASGALASGSVASGAVASGAYASGSIGSGAIASGALASGSVASGAIASGALASGSIASGALASGSIAAGAIAAGATSIADNEDAASADGDRGVKILARQTATAADTAGTDLDYAPIQMKNGRVWASSIATGTNAHDAAAVETNPVTIGFEAVNQDGTPAPNGVSAEGDTVRGIADSYGRQYVSNQHPNSWCANETETVATTDDAIKAAPGAGLSLYVCSLIISNGATAGTYLLEEDTATTKVTLQPTVFTAINGGAVINYEPCIRVTANKDIGITSATVTTGSYVVCGYTAP